MFRYVHCYSPGSMNDPGIAIVVNGIEKIIGNFNFFLLNFHVIA